MGFGIKVLVISYLFEVNILKFLKFFYFKLLFFYFFFGVFSCKNIIFLVFFVVSEFGV